MTASPMTNGGVMMGRTVRTRSIRLARKPVRVTTSAKASPRTVVENPTSTAIHREFHATPHVTGPVRQSRPQMVGETNFRANTAGATLPASSWNALRRMVTTGKKMKAATSAITSPMAPTTNTSPLITPRAAIPRVSRNRNAAVTSTAPYPMPNCRSSRGPKVRSSSANSQPEMPMANPWPTVTARPRAPMAIRALANSGS